MKFEIDTNHFNNNALIDSRVSQCQQGVQGALRTALSYLYLDDGPVNLPRDRRVAAEPHLDPTEVIVVRWLATRTNGKLRKTYGGGALRAARSQQYRCESCGYSDVRALNIDHISGKADPDTAFACLCANCHAIKSREKDWSGVSVRQVATTT